MRTLKTLTPGQDGTKELMARYGPNLLCVRYRYDEDTRERLKTVALIVQRRTPERTAEGFRSQASADKERGAAARKVALRIAWQERDLQSRVKSAGGRWDPARRVWMVRRDVAERLELLDRVVGGGA